MGDVYSTIGDLIDVIQLTEKLITILSVFSEEHEIADFIASYLDFSDVQYQKVKNSGPNVIAKNIVNDGKTILLNAHMDTVPIMRGWSRAPFKAEIKNKKLYGLGAADMKAGLAIILNVFKELKEEVNLILVATSDEEGNSNGAYTFLKSLKENDIALCLIPEPTNEKIRLGCRGRFVVDIEIIGESAHASRPTLGANAIVDCAKVIDALKKVKIRSHKKLGYGSICPLKIEGGGDSLSIPQYCRIRVDRHVVPGETKSMIKNDFNSALTNLDVQSEIRVSFMKRETPFLKPYLIDMKNEMIKSFCTEYKKFYGKIKIVYGKSVGDYNLFAEKMPTIVFGPNGENTHASDEFVYTDSILRCRDLYLTFLRSLKIN